jgi:RHS repeat-associated protein
MLGLLALRPAAAQSRWKLSVAYSGAASVGVSVTPSTPNDPGGTPTANGIPLLQPAASLQNVPNTPAFTSSGGITGTLLIDLPNRETQIYQRTAGASTRNGSLDVTLTWQPKNGDAAQDPPPATVVVVFQRQVSGYASCSSDGGNPLPDTASASAQVSFGAVYGLPALSVNTGTLFVNGPPKKISSPANADRTMTQQTLTVTNGVAQLHFPFTFSLSGMADNRPHPTGAASDTQGMLRVDVCVAGTTISRAVPDGFTPHIRTRDLAAINPFSGDVSPSDNDPTFTRWLPLTFAPVLTGQPFRTQSGPLPQPWGNLHCAYSISLQQEGANPNYDLNNGVIPFYPGPGMDGTYNSPGPPYRAAPGAFVPKWVITDANGSRLVFDASYVPYSDVHSRLFPDPPGWQLADAGPPGALGEKGRYTYSFNAFGRLSYIQEALDGQTTLTQALGWSNQSPYPPNALFLSVLDSSSGRTLKFFTGAGGYLGAVDAPALSGSVPNTHTTLAYNTGGHVTGIYVHTGDGATLLHGDTFTYDSSVGDAFASVQQGAGVVSYTYYADFAPTDPFRVAIGRVKTAAYGAPRDTNGSDQSPPASIQGTCTFTYGTLTPATSDPNRKYLDAWSADARTQTITDPRGRVYTTTYTLSGGSQGAIIGENFYAPDYRGAPPLSNYAFVTYQPDILNPAHVWTTDAIAPNGPPWTLDLDGVGNPILFSDPLTHTWTFGYSASKTELTGVTDPTGKTWTFNYGETVYGHSNPASRLTSVIDPANMPRIAIDYNGYGQPETIAIPAVTASTGQMETITFSYDPARGDLMQMTDPLGDTLKVNSYDALGDPLSVTVFPDTGRPATSTGPLTTSFLYDAAQMPTAVSDPGGGLLTAHYTNGVPDQYQIQHPNVTDNQGHVIPLARMTLNVNTRGQVYRAADLVGTLAEYRYDLAGNLTRILDGRGRTVKLTYGDANELIHVTWPDGTLRDFWYDARGRLTQAFDERGVHRVFAWDNANRLTDAALPDFAGQNVHITYDDANRPLAIDDPATLHEYTWDTQPGGTGARLLAVATTFKALPVGSNRFVVSYAYFPDGRLQAMRSVAGETDYTYDRDGELTALVSPYGETTAWTYDHAGRVTAETTTRGATRIATAYTWGRSNILGDFNTAPAYLSDISQTVNGQFFADYSLRHTYLNQLDLQLEAGPPVSGPSGSDYFTYDRRGRLASENDIYLPDSAHRYTYAAPGYQYDLANNLEGGYGWTYNDNNQATLAPYQPGSGLLGASGLSYDPAGHLTGMDGLRYTWDPWGRLSDVGNLHMTYDFAGRRVSKRLSGLPATYYLYAGDLPIAELDGAGNVQRTYTWGALGLISDHDGPPGIPAGAASPGAPGALVRLPFGPSPRYYLYDGLGNTRTLLGGSGQVLARGAYSAWGLGLSASVPFPDTPFTWKGRWGVFRDWETGNYLMGARCYAPNLGRFLSRDPSGFGSGPNLYAYCADDPVNLMDLDGCEFDPIGWYMGGMGGFSNLVDDYLLGGSTKAFGDAAGRYDAGKASPTEVLVSAAIWGVNLASAAFLVKDVGQVLVNIGRRGWARLAECGGPNCFAAGTLVAVRQTGPELALAAWKEKSSSEAVRFKPIEQVTADDQVASRNEVTGQTEWKRVLGRSVRHSDAVVTVALANSVTGAVVEQITATREHPFFVEGQGFVPAGGLAVGNAIVTRAGPSLVVKGVTWHRRTEGYAVYNLVVEDDHTYFVGKANGGLWVHNGVRCPGTLYKEPTRYRTGIRDKVWKNAQGADGVVRDPMTEEQITGDWDMGHKPGYEFRKLTHTAEEQGWTRKEFLDAYNDENIYRPESVNTSRSHAGELGDEINNWINYYRHYSE